MLRRRRLHSDGRRPTNVPYRRLRRRRRRVRSAAAAAHQLTRRLRRSDHPATARLLRRISWPGGASARPASALPLARRRRLRPAPIFSFGGWVRFADPAFGFVGRPSWCFGPARRAEGWHEIVPARDRAGRSL